MLQLPPSFAPRSCHTMCTSLAAFSFSLFVSLSFPLYPFYLVVCAVQTAACQLLTLAQIRKQCNNYFHAQLKEASGQTTTTRGYPNYPELFAAYTNCLRELKFPANSLPQTNSN